MSRVYVGKLSYRAREKDVERFFKGYGKILEVDLKNGYGFVEFDDPRDADDAVCDLNGKDLCGKRVIVEHTIGQRRDGGSRPGRKSDRLPLLLAMVSPFQCVWLFDQTGPLGRPLKRANVKEDRFSH
uniref:Serine and arginine rich splicing factor 4 n=1 Tax=Cyprinus carpio carpio TaxID=630221 RepID=A0A8C1H7Z0_CYPCA